MYLSVRTRNVLLALARGFDWVAQWLRRVVRATTPRKSRVDHSPEAPELPR